MYVPDPAGYVECRFKAGATTDSPGNKECVSVVGNIDTDNPNHFSTQAACKNDCGNSYNCINCDCGISKGLNGAEILATCDASCPDKTYRCDNGRCIQDVCPSAGNPGLTYAACKLQCGKYRCPGSTTTTGGVIAWGSNNNGHSLGTNASGNPITSVLTGAPVQLMGQVLTGVTAIAASSGNNTIALKDGEVLSWGTNIFGLSTVPASVTSGVSAIAAGLYHIIALKGGEVIAWGNKDYGQCAGTDALGNPITSTPTGAPVQINGVTLSGVTAIAGGYYHTIAIKDGSVMAGSVLAWGDNTNGQCNIPANVDCCGGVSAIAGGYRHTIALRGGAVFAWGRNNEGQCLGSNSIGQAITSTATGAPVQILGQVLTGVSAIASGYNHTIALKNGGVLAWGLNDYGQCNIPDAAKSGVIAIAGGGSHTIGLKDDGTGLAWGFNGYGACLGTNSNGQAISGTPTGQPVQVLGSVLNGVTAIASGEYHTIAIGGTVTTATKCDFYGDTDTGFDTNALCEANTTCNTGVKYQCVYTTCPNGRVLGSTCQPTTTFVAGVTYYDTFGQCEASACADVIDQGNRWKCVNNDCVFVDYCDGDGTYKEESGPNGCRDNCWGWNCKNNQCTSERFAINNHDNCAESCHCKWSAINISGQGTACPACIKLCGRELADARSSNVPCSDEWATTCPVAYGYYDTEAACKQFLIDNDFGEFICKENGACERLNPAFPLETECGKYCSKSACEASCRRASPGYECVEPPIPYSGRTTCRQITSCSGGTAPYETLEDCISGCDYTVSRGWNCRTSDNGSSTCVALTSINDGIPQFTSSALCNRFCINNFGWNCKSNVCIKAWEAPGSFSSYAQCLSVCNAPDPNQGPCGNVIDSTTGSVNNNGGSTA